MLAVRGAYDFFAVNAKKCERSNVSVHRFGRSRIDLLYLVECVIGYAWVEGSFVSSGDINPIVESAILVRKELKLTQAGFARCLNISPRTLRDWEQGRRHPSGAALTLLRWVIDRPDYVREIHELAPERLNQSLRPK